MENLLSRKSRIRSCGINRQSVGGVKGPVHRTHAGAGSRSSTCYGSGDDVSWWMLRTVCVLVVCVTCVAGQKSTDVATTDRSGVCQSRDIRNTVDQFSQLEGCRVIEGFLQIVLIDKADPSEYDNLTFPELREVTGYILLYRVNNLRSLGKLFPNLSVIRGNDLFFDYSLVAFEMLHLQELGLSSLTDILRGGVYFVKNPMLCYIDTIDWDLISRQAPKGPDAKKEEIHFIRSNKKKNECPICPKECPQMMGSQEHLCWSPQHCQKVCPVSCGMRACNITTGACCHEDCLGGCSGNGSSSCFACRGVLHNNQCLPSCPPGTFKYQNRRCVTEKECHEMPKPRQVTSDEMPAYPWKPFKKDGECILHCPAGYLDYMVGNRYNCKPCEGICRKECPAINVDSIAKAQKLRDCTFIKGSLEIQIRGGINVVKELEENLNMIEEIQGYLKIIRSFPLMSLNFLKKLKVIQGTQLESGKYSLVVLDNQNLLELWDWETKGKNLKILNGRLFFHFNPKLCIGKIDELKKIANLPNYTDMEVAQNSNGDKVACDVQELNASVYKRSSKAVLIRWKQFSHYDSRTLLGYVVYSIEAPYQNVTMYDGRDACGGDGWRVDDVSPPDPESLDKDKESSEPQEMHHILTQLLPYTQYAFYIKTYTIATEKVGAQSKIQYFRTFPDTPTVPRALKAFSNSSSVLVIHWNAPATPNGNVTHYVVRGVWERDDQKFLEQRNYCSEPLTLPDKKPSQQKSYAEDPEGDDPIDPNLGLYNGKDDKCPCKKDDREEKEKKQREKEIQFQINFEDALHNQVYVKRPVGTRDKREINFRADNKGSNGFLNMDKSVAVIQEDSKNKVVGGVYENFEHIVWNQHTLVVRNLRHFAHYTISVMACRELIPEEPLHVKTNCSAQAIISARTLPLDTADTVKLLNVHVMDASNHSGVVLLKWDEPISPNGLIVTYQIEYQRIDIQNIKPTIECITRVQYHNMSRAYMLRNLGPGNYSVRVRATSLAGNGNWTDYFNFYIPERQSMSITTLLVLTILSLMLVVVLVFCALYFHRKQIQQEVVNKRLIATVNPEYVSTVYVEDQWEVPRSQIELVRELGQGSFGMVWEGLARDVVPNNPLMACAVKTVNEAATDRERIEFLNEASVMKGFNTHHVVRLVGVVSKGQPTLVVMELMAEGDLKTYLRSHRPDITDDPTKLPPTLRRILQMAIEIADGMAYLAAKKFVHRDLAARNCMVAEDLTVKIGDFGMTRDIYETDYYRKGTKGLLPVRWMAPESLKDGVFTSNSDVWSYGVVIWEMATLASQPYQGLSNDQVLRYVIDGGVMEEPVNCPEKLYDLMRRCWQHKPTLRPSFLDLVTMLLPDVNSSFASVSFYHSDEGQELRGVAAGETTPLRVTRDIEDFSLGSDDEQDYKQSSGSHGSKVSNGSTTPNGYICPRPNGIKTTKC